MKLSQFIEDNTCIKVYDPKTKQLVETFNNYRKASDALGLTYKVLQNRIVTKERVFAPKLGFEIAVRLGKKEVVYAWPNRG